MQIEIVHRPANSAARIKIAPSETMTAEAGAMVAMSSNITMSTTTHKKGKGGILKAAKRLLSGESFFLNHYEAHGQDGEVILATSLPGDMMTYNLQGERLIVQAGSYVASEHSVNMDMGWQGMKSLFSGESMFWLNMSGHGQIVLSSFGCIYPVPVQGETIVDTGHIVAFNETLSFEITKAGKSWMSSILGGEGLVCKFKGTGTVWCQSHNATSFGRSIGPKLRPRRA